MLKKRRTKIIATLGPATASEEALKGLLAAGVDLVRINFSHGTEDEKRQIVTLTRRLAAELGKEIGIIGDLQGPKIRIGQFKAGSVELHNGAAFVLDAGLALDQGDGTQVGIAYKQLPKDVIVGDKLLLDDGRLVLQVQQVIEGKIFCIVNVGGVLSNNKGINRVGGGLSAKALTEKDKNDIKLAVELALDYVAVSFPRDAEDIKQARHLVEQAGGTLGIIAKIERVEALQHIDDIIVASNAVMVARGDLGVEIGFAEVPAVQKHIIARARALDRAVITATQMMESMILEPVPTRAEVSDVVNAVLDGTDAVMLSAETAVGHYPQKVVTTMVELCLSAERHPRSQTSRHRLDVVFQRVDETIAMAAMYIANHFAIKAIVTLTETGATPLWMSRIRSGIPIYALSRHLATCRKMTLYRGVYPVEFDPTKMLATEIDSQAIYKLVDLAEITKEDRVILTKGDFMGATGGTNMLKVVEVAHVLAAQ